MSMMMAVSTLVVDLISMLYFVMYLWLILTPLFGYEKLALGFLADL